jgi:ribose transport system ATP-binding protein
MAHLMVGRDLGSLFPAKQAPADGPIAMAAKELSVGSHVAHANFELRRGEILGFGGLIGAGRTELFEGLMGLRPASGRIEAGQYHGKPFASLAAAAAAGLAYVTEDRKGKGLLLDASLANNLTLANLWAFTRLGLIDSTQEGVALDAAFERYDIRAKSRTIDAGRLSGGNQQKLLLAKVLQGEPSIIIIDEPTRGVDIGAKQQIYALIADLVAQGRSIIVISSEMPELIGLCHRVVVMHQGQIAGTLAGDAITERNIVTLATGTERQAA